MTQRRVNRQIRNFVLVALMVAFLTASGVSAQTYEVQTDRNVADILPAGMITGPHYQIMDRVIADGYMHRFTVFSDFGMFEVTGEYALRKLLKEIQAIAAIKKMKESKAYLDSVKNAAKKPVEFGVNLITDPVDTVTGVPKGVYRLFSNIGTAVTTSRDPSEDRRAETLLLLSSYKRDYAAELGVDVYSSNPVLQKELNSLGWAGAAGSLSVSAALAPFGGPGFKAIKASRLSKQFNDLLKEEPAPRLRRINQEKLKAMGVSSELAAKFLDHQAFTPRHDTIIVGCLASLTYARSRHIFVQLALTAEDEESANFFQNMAETLSGYNERVSRIKDLTVTYGLVFAKAENGSVVIPFPLDHGVWSERGEWVVKSAIGGYQKAMGTSTPGNLELWVTGTVTPLAKQQFAQLGMKVFEDIDQKIEFMD
jgi:hypothetical protein